MKNHLSLFLVSVLSLIIFFSSVKAQSGLKKTGSSSINKGNRNFYDIQKTFNEYWKKKSDTERDIEENKDGEWEQFKRWEWFAEQRVYPSGNFFDPEILVKEYFKYKAANPHSKSLGGREANWTFIGPHSVPGGGGGAGRINCMAFDPNNSNTLFIGAACGGLWKSIDGGNSWSSNTDLLPSLSISEIVINPINTNIMYIATGDKYGYFAGLPGFFGGTYSAGLMKSFDGGASWNPTSLNYSQMQGSFIQRVIVNPLNPNILIVATNTGIYRSSDAATTFTNMQAGNFCDLEFNTADPNIIFASSFGGLYRSNDNGITWFLLSATFCAGGRTSIAVTPANSNVIYLWCSGGDFCKSTDCGATWSLMSSPGTLVTDQGWYGKVLAVSPLDANVIYAGGLIVGKSTDGGSTWNAKSVWYPWTPTNYVHADNHNISFLPGGNGATVFSCNDGGIFKTTDAGSTWNDLSNGLDIKQYYRLGCSALDPNLIYGGAQDNGTDLIYGFYDYNVNSSDGMECFVDYTNNNIVYTSWQNGSFHKSINGANTFPYDITPAGITGAWITPMVMHPTNPQILFAGYQDVYKSIDGGNSWNTISNNIDGGATLNSVVVSPSNPDYIYVASFGNIFRTTNGGTSWSTITQNLPVSSAAITGIAINSANPDNVWVTFSGYANGNKVFNTTDGGLTWTNISGTLPNIPVNCIVYQNGSNDILYIGTDFGVYYRYGNMNDWVFYNAGLPNVIIDELEIQYAAGKLRAATFGRGIWESDLNTSTLINDDAGAQEILSPSGNYCNTNILPVIRIKNFGLDTLFSVIINYQIDGGAITSYLLNGIIATSEMGDITLPSLTLSSGNHTFYAYTSNPNNTTDNNAANDSNTISFSINPNATGPPIVEGFVSSSFPPPGWSLQDSILLLSRAAAVGGFGNSNGAIEANCFLIAGGPAYLISPSINFSNLTAPVKMDFSVAYARYDTTYHDSLFASVSTDCGATFTRVYLKGDIPLSTASNTTNSFTPLNSQWRAESINLNAYIGSANVIVRFEFKSGYGNNIYIDDINIYGANTAGINQLEILQSVSIYPNPAFDQLTISGLSFSSDDNINVEIFNAIGERIYDTPITKNKIDIRTIKPGIYLIKIATSKGLVSKKFIKIKCK